MRAAGSNHIVHLSAKDPRGSRREAPRIKCNNPNNPPLEGTRRLWRECRGNPLVFLEIGKVETEGACSLPGVSINFDKFVKILRRAVQKGFVARDKAAFVEHGLRFGFDLGLIQPKFACLIQNLPTRNLPTFERNLDLGQCVH